MSSWHGLAAILRNVKVPRMLERWLNS